jgi:uncharacterized membrane protein YeaQ/YmgE (transglycosylase-associated protein family)
MFTVLGIIGWLVYGLLIGLVAKALYPAGDGAKGFLGTVLVGIAGSFIGGAINWVMNFGGPYHPAGILLSIVGGVVFCWVYRTYHLNQYIHVQQLRIKELEGTEKKE